MLEKPIKNSNRGSMLIYRTPEIAIVSIGLMSLGEMGLGLKSSSLRKSSVNGLGRSLRGFGLSDLRLLDSISQTIQAVAMVCAIFQLRLRKRCAKCGLAENTHGQPKLKLEFSHQCAVTVMRQGAKLDALTKVER